MTLPRKETRFLLIALVALLLLPFATMLLGDRAWLLSLSVGSYCLLYMINAQALNVQVGMTGLLNLGPIAFVGLGAYTGALMLTAGDNALIGFYAGFVPELSGHLRWVLFFLDPNFLAYLTVIPVAIVLSMLLSLLLGLPTLKLSGDYFAIVTLGFAQIFYLVVKNEAWLTKGSAGVTDVPALFSFCTGPNRIEFFSHTAHYFFGVAVLAVCLYVVVRLRDSYLGRGLLAVRDNELAAQSNGVNVAKYRMLSFMVFSALAALGGVAMLARAKFVSPNDLNFMESILFLCCVVLGGMGSVRGVLLGGIALGALGEVMRIGLPVVSETIGYEIPAQVRYVLFGMILILVMRYRPNGILPVAAEEHAGGLEKLGAHRDAEPTFFKLGTKG
ncbi:MAG: branched-chain amino acid ABC transporter permease [Planctomycetes bacterium]|nr:branched-chain amino acid ABC transporter permease [Planctomycetota bacterium]